jgi:hypothetical protein
MEKENEIEIRLERDYKEQKDSSDGKNFDIKLLNR